MSKRGWPHVDDPTAVGRRLKEARLAAGLSQRELSFPGCTAVYICRIERGDRVPSLQVLRELANRVGVDEEYLARGASRVDKTDQLVEGDVALALDQLELAEHFYTQVLDASDRVRHARALGGLGQIDLHAGRIEDAIRRLEEARELLGDAVVEHMGIVDGLARSYSIEGEYESAIGLLERTIDAARDRGDENAESQAGILLANALIDSGDLPAARTLLGKALANVSAAADPLVQARLFWSQSRLHSAEENAPAAARFARRALAAIEVTENVEYAARAHQLLAFVELEQGNAAEALELLERGEELASRRLGAEAADLFPIERARALAMLGRDDEAVALAVKAAKSLVAERPEQAGRAYAIAAEVYAAAGERERALDLYGVAAELLESSSPRYLLDVYSKTAELLEQMGRKDEALELLKKAVGLRARVQGAA